jgi:TatD DNase family protein
MLVDSHCHLNYPGLGEDVPGVLARARDAGVGRFLAIAAKQADWDPVLEIATAQPDVYASVGVHPHEAEREGDTPQHVLAHRAQHPRVIAIGETGLDYFYDHSPRAEQQRSFQTHLDAARETGLPVIVHTRDAEDDTARLLQAAVGKGGVTGVIHCFTASAAFAQIALDIGFYISLSGILTFKSAKDLQETAKALPLDRLMVETDSPYLAPIPMRGKPCEPAYVAHTARFLAQLKGEREDVIAHTTTANFFKLFAKAA